MLYRNRIIACEEAAIQKLATLLYYCISVHYTSAPVTLDSGVSNAVSVAIPASVYTDSG